VDGVETTAVDAATAATAGVPDERRLRTAVACTYVAFSGTGVGFASLASRLPQLRDLLHLTPGALGVLILFIAIGSMTAMPLSGLVVGRFGTARTVAVLSVVYAAGMATVALGLTHGVIPVAIGLFLLGVGNGVWDVAMNVQAAGVERILGRSIMSRFHAGFSVGTVGGAAVGAAMVAGHVPVGTHLLLVAIVILAAIPYSTRGFLTDPPQHVEHAESGRRRRFVAWTEPRTLLIGLFVLCMAFTEGTGNDWLSIAMIDGYGTAAVLGTIAYTVFLIAMTTGRWFGPAAIDRYGRVPVLRVSALTAFVGLVVVIVGSWYPLALVGSALWGIGTALGFPTGISAASDDPARAAARVSVAASIGYVAFLAGPPLIGAVGNHVGVLHGLTVTAGVLVVALAVSGVTAPPVDESERGPMATNPAK
jgi:predicted MFS family arabinose efflux permease